jgi:hypothetical protein
MGPGPIHVTSRERHTRQDNQSILSKKARLKRGDTERTKEEDDLALSADIQSLGQETQVVVY